MKVNSTIPFSTIVHLLTTPPSDAQVPYADGNETETEPSEHYPEYTLTLFQIILLIFRSAAARQRRQVMRLLAASEIGRLFHATVEDVDFDDDDDNEDELDEDNILFTLRRPRPGRRPRPDPNRFPKVPSDKGTELMNSGVFGSNEIQTVKTGDTNNISKRKKLARRILDRELATEIYAKQKVNQRLMAQVGLPSDVYALHLLLILF
jgi:WD repeat-containing protein 23